MTFLLRKIVPWVICFCVLHFSLISDCLVCFSILQESVVRATCCLWKTSVSILTRRVWRMPSPTPQLLASLNSQTHRNLKGEQAERVWLFTDSGMRSFNWLCQIEAFESAPPACWLFYCCGLLERCLMPLLSQTCLLVTLPACWLFYCCGLLERCCLMLLLSQTWLLVTLSVF